MRFVVWDRKTLKFIRSQVDPAKIEVFESYSAAESVATSIGCHAGVIEVK